MASRYGSGLDRRSFLVSGVAAGASLALGGLAFNAAAQDRRLATVGATAKTQYGSVRGLLKDGVQQFWCVPYGASTAGANRFMPPQKPAAWSGVKDHFEITWAAPMDPNGEEPSPVVTALNRKTPQSEDCLTVNVFTPGLDNRARPVMVWMHGGGFSAGSGVVASTSTAWPHAESGRASRVAIARNTCRAWIRCIRASLVRAS